jgi:hypothetical protein
MNNLAEMQQLAKLLGGGGGGQSQGTMPGLLPEGGSMGNLSMTGYRPPIQAVPQLQEGPSATPSPAPAPPVSRFGRVNSAINAGGDWVNKNARPLSMAADLANIIGGYSNKSGRGFELQKRVGNMLSGTAANNQLTPGAGPQPAGNTPPGRMVSEKTTTTVDRKFDLNNNGIDDRLEGGAGGGTRLGQVPFPQGASEQVGTPAPVAQGPNNAPSAQSLNIGDMPFLGWTQGFTPTVDIAKTREQQNIGRETNAINREELVPKNISANAARLNAETNAAELPIKQANVDSEITRRRFQNAKDEADAAKDLWDRSPKKIELEGAIEQAKKTGDATAQRVAVEEAAKNADRIPVLEPTLRKIFPTYGALMRATGTISTAPLDAAIAATASGHAAAITAGGLERSALATIVTSINTALEPYDKLVDPIVVDPKKPDTISDKRIQDWQVSVGKIKLNTPENVAERTRLKALQRRSMDALGGLGGLSKADERRRKEESIQIRVNGKMMPATKISETQARGEDGKLYNIKPAK